MSTQGHKLFDRLPAVYRLKDAQQSGLSAAQLAELSQLQGLQSSGVALTTQQQQQLNLLLPLSRGPLQSLLMLIEEQMTVVDIDLDQLYDDQFIETCASWAIPYIGDLIGYKPVYGVAPAVASPRAEVAHTISFRRRKGTILVLEQLARDVTGWGAHAVEFFKILSATQYMKHIRSQSYYSPDLRSWMPRAYMDSGFDTTAHTIDVRFIAGGEGRYNVPNIGIFLWSLNACSLTNIPVTAVDATGQFFRVSTLGADMPLFNNPMSQGSQISQAAQPVNVPARLLRRVLCQDLQSGAGALYYGQGSSLALYLNGTLLNPYQIQVCNLSGADGHWANVPSSSSPYIVAIDPELGRIALAKPLSSPPAAGSPATSLQTSIYCGFNAEMGGGEYSRSETFLVDTPSAVLPYPDTQNPARYSTLQAALTYALANAGGQGQMAVEITDSGIYPLNTASSSGLQLNLPAGMTLELRGADSHRPTLILGSEITVLGQAGSSLCLNGLLLAYAAGASVTAIPVALIHVPSTGNALTSLQLNHCTVVPGLALTAQGVAQNPNQPAVMVECPGTQLNVQKSIVGEVLVHQLASATISDSVVDACASTGVAYAALDGTSGGGSLSLQGCTVIGKVHAALLSLVTNCILWANLAAGDSWAAPVIADRKQQGCVRFTYLPFSAEATSLPRQFECMQRTAGGPEPVFYSLQYGDPGYAKLWPSTNDGIRRGADDGGEMGAFHFVMAPMRETDLGVRIQEYLPVGLQCGIFYQT